MTPSKPQGTYDHFNLSIFSLTLSFNLQRFKFLPKWTFGNLAPFFSIWTQRLWIDLSKILFPTSRLCVRRLAPIPAGESQDVTNKSCFPYVLGVTKMPSDPMTPGVPGALEPRMYPRSGYFLVIYILISSFRLKSETKNTEITGQNGKIMWYKGEKMLLYPDLLS